MARAAVVCSLYGGYDVPHPPPVQDTDTEFVLVTDRDYDVPPWRVVTEPRPQLHPRTAVKVAKAHPDWYADADMYVWVDANVQILSSGFVSWCVSSLGDGQLATNPHPWAATTTEELGLTRNVGYKYGGLTYEAQVAHYLAEGFPDPPGGNLWTNIIARPAAACAATGDMWLATMMRWTNQDQLSLPYVLWRAGITPVLLDLSVTGTMYQSARHTGPEPQVLPDCWQQPVPAP